MEHPNLISDKYLKLKELAIQLGYTITDEYNVISFIHESNQILNVRYNYILDSIYDNRITFKDSKIIDFYDRYDISDYKYTKPSYMRKFSVEDFTKACTFKLRSIKINKLKQIT